MKVLVGCPTYSGKEYCLKEYIAGINSLLYKNFDVLLVDNSKDESFFKKLVEISENWESKKSQRLFLKRLPFASKEPRNAIVLSRNFLREYVLKNGYDYFLSLEADVIPPVDVIERLLSRGKKLSPAFTLIFCRKQVHW